MERPSGRVNGGHGRSVAALAVLVLLITSLLPMCAPDDGGSEAQAGEASGERYEVTYVNEYPDEQYADNILNDWVGVGDSYTIAYYGTPVSEYNPQFWST